MSDTAILLLAHGTPEALDDIPEYLRNVTSGRPLPQQVVEEIRHRYSLIGQSPLTGITLEQGRLLSEAVGMPTYVGMRNWKPYIVDMVKQMRADGIRSAVAICLAPHNSRTSVGLYRRAVQAEAGDMRIEFIEGWAEHPLLADAFADRLRPVLGRLREETGSDVPVLFTAHSVPCRTVQTQSPAAASAADARPERPAPPTSNSGPDPYAIEAKRTAALVAARIADLKPEDWFFAFQSQGMSGGPWLGPTVEETLAALAAAGRKSIVLQPIGFLCDHVEILYDIDIAFRKLASSLGMRLERPQSLNDSPLLISALEDLAHQGLERLQSERA
ncbi:MAG TPA: ferrochelatase [Acidisarcina sp.]|nr:ferrochelatase [Acidisarcina sp.]